MLDIAKHVKEIKSSSYDALTEKLLCSNEPVILRGLVGDWPLVKQGQQSAEAADKYLRHFITNNLFTSCPQIPRYRADFFIRMICAVLILNEKILA